MNVFSSVFQVIAVILAAIGGAAGITAFFKIGPDRRKMAADAFRAGVDSVEALNRTAISLNEPYLEQIRFLRDELMSARGEISALRIEIRQLQAGLP